MEVHNLLQKQIEDCLGSGYALTPELRRLVGEVNAIYWRSATPGMKPLRKRKGAARQAGSEQSETRAVLSVLPDLFLRIDKNGKILYVDGGRGVDFLFAPEELVGAHVSEIPLDPVSSLFVECLRKTRATRAKHSVEYSVEHDSYPLYFEASFVPLSSGEVVSTIRNVTERKTAENRLRKAHEQTEQILGAIPSILIWVDSNDRVNEWSTMAENAFGLKASAVLGKAFIELDVAWDWVLVLEKIADCRERKEAVRLEDVKFTRCDGKDGFLNMTITPIQDQQAGHAGYLLLGSDVTERKFLEDQLSQAQKLESIGQLAAGIAHEINTPTQYVGDNARFLLTAFTRLTAIMNKYSDLLTAAKKKTLTDEMVTSLEQLCSKKRLPYLLEEIPRAIQEALDGVERIAGIVKAMKEYSHPGVEKKTLTDINKALKNTITVTRNEWKYCADLEKQFDESLPLVPCLPGELNQVFLNVIVNASHAIKDANEKLGRKKGRITVRTEYNDDWVRVSIGDNGTGIPKAYRAKVFDPFFTSKEVGKGTGQGLAISHNVVVEKHGGSITFETREGRGTTFTICLPLAVEQ